MKQPVPLFKGIAKNGTMIIYNIGQFKRYLLTLNGIECEIIVRKFRKKRSLKQNAYFHGVICVYLGDEWGYTVKEAHSAIAGEFLTVKPEGKPPFVRSTTDLSTKEFKKFNDDVVIWAAKKHNVRIPDPGQTDFL